MITFTKAQVIVKQKGYCASPVFLMCKGQNGDYQDCPCKAYCDSVNNVDCRQIGIDRLRIAKKYISEHK